MDESVDMEVPEEPIAAEDYLAHVGSALSQRVFVEDPDEWFDLMRVKPIVVAALDEREWTVVRMYYFEDRTFAECGEELGITSSRANQLMIRALRKLRHPSVCGRLPRLGWVDRYGDRLREKKAAEAWGPGELGWCVFCKTDPLRPTKVPAVTRLKHWIWGGCEVCIEHYSKLNHSDLQDVLSDRGIWKPGKSWLEKRAFQKKETARLHGIFRWAFGGDGIMELHGRPCCDAVGLLNAAVAKCDAEPKRAKWGQPNSVIEFLRGAARDCARYSTMVVKVECTSDYVHVIPRQGGKEFWNGATIRQFG